jgi:hypothetical protein
MAYGSYGIWLDYRLDPYRRNIPKPHREEMFPSARARALFRRERTWKRWQAVVWIGTFVLLNVLCARDLWRAAASEYGRSDAAARQTSNPSHP